MTALPPDNHVDVVIEAGHEKRKRCDWVELAFATRPCALGTEVFFTGEAVAEVDWNIRVADSAADYLSARGYRVLRIPADHNQRIDARFGVFIHADGHPVACASGPSVGYPPEQGPDLGERWKAFYKDNVPDVRDFRFIKDNVTNSLRDYYNYKFINAPHLLVIEIAEMTCPQQFFALNPRLVQVGQTVGAFIDETLGSATVSSRWRWGWN
ncbi:MAG: hypothetical protein ACFB6S_09770 [Geminicoccaceae bacterium]